MKKRLEVKKQVGSEKKKLEVKKVTEVENIDRRSKTVLMEKVTPRSHRKSQILLLKNLAFFYVDYKFLTVI